MSNLMSAPDELTNGLSEELIELVFLMVASDHGIKYAQVRILRFSVRCSSLSLDRTNHFQADKPISR